MSKSAQPRNLKEKEMIKSLNAIASGAGLNTCKDAANLIERLAGRK